MTIGSRDVVILINSRMQRLFVARNRRKAQSGSASWKDCPEADRVGTAIRENQPHLGQDLDLAGLAYVTRCVTLHRCLNCLAIMIE